LKPFLYDIVRTMKSKALIALVVLVLFSSLTIVPQIASFRASGSSFQEPYFVLSEHDSNGYHFISFTANQFGQPLKANYMVSLSTQFQVPSNYTTTLRADASGVGLGTIAAPNATYFINVEGRGGGGMPEAPDGVVHPVAFNVAPFFSPVSDSKDASIPRLLIFWAGEGLSPPVGCRVYYKVNSGSMVDFSNDTSLEYLGTLQHYATIFPLPSDFSLSGTDAISLGLFSPNGTLLIWTAPYGNGEFVGQRAMLDLNSFVSYNYTQVFGIFVPLVGILGAYDAYGKDKTSGVIDSVLVRPISRGRLLLSRYIATVLPLSLAAALGVLVVDFFVHLDAGVFLSPSFLLGMAGAMAVETAAFAGLTMLMSQFVKGSGGLIILSLMMFVALDLVWGVILPVLQPLYGAMSASLVQLEIYSGMANPSQFLPLTETFRQGTIYLQTTAEGGLQIPAASFGLTIWSLCADGVAWIGFPLLIALHIAKRRD
jgi:ABC-2 type transport system permease protein